MTVGEIIQGVEKARPGCNLSLDDLLFEINSISKEIYDNIVSMHENCGEYRKLTSEAETIDIPDFYSDIFKYRLMAKIDIENTDITRYSNNMILYNNLLSSYKDWYTRNHIPKQKAKLRWN